MKNKIYVLTDEKYRKRVGFVKRLQKLLKGI